MSDLFKLLFTTILHCALLTSPSLMAQETSAVPNAENEQLKIFNLVNSNAKEAADILTVLYDGPSVRITVDQRTNAVIVRADESRLSEIEAVLLRLDEQPNSGGAKSSTGKIQASGFYLREDSSPIVASGTDVPIAEYRRQLDALEQPVLQLAEQVRTAETKHGKDYPDSAKLRADLRALIQQTFAARQKIQRAELAEFTRRLQHMQQSIDARDRIADKVIDRRLEELLDPDIAWTQLSTPLVQSESTSPTQPPEPKIISEVSEEKQTVSIERRKKLSDMLASLQGEWKCEVFNIEGESVIRSGDLPILKIEGSVAATSLKILDVDDYPSSKEPEVHVLDATWFLELNGAETPQHVNLLFDPNGEKRQQYGIIDCSDDRLRICIASEEPESETSRPGIFASGSKVIYVEARKQDAELSSVKEGTEKPKETVSQNTLSETSVTDEPRPFLTDDAVAESERAAAVLVDLMPYYSGLAKDFDKATRFPWKWVPRGSQTFANVPLDIGGRICLWGERNANVNGQVFPEKVEGIAIDREFETLFVYHCTFFESPQGTPVYELIFHYEDNTSASDTIRYLDDVRDWYCYPGEKQPGPTNDRSALVWHGASIMENGAAPGDIQMLRFCLTEVENPHPDRKVKSIDLVSSKNQSAGCILAMTLGKSTLMRRASPEPE